MDGKFGQVFMFLTNLAWKSRIALPVLVTTVFLIMDIRLQIEINIQSGQIAAAELGELSDSEDDDDEEDDNSDDDQDDVGEEYTTDDSSENNGGGNFYCFIRNGVDENRNNVTMRSQH